MTECIFCKIINGEMPCFKVYEDENVIGFLDIYPITEGHILIATKKHYQDMLEMNLDESKSIMKAANKLGKDVMTKLGAEGFNFTTNNGAAAGQDIFHLHFHILPRKKDDGLVSWPNHNTNMEELKALAEKLKK